MNQAGRKGSGDGPGPDYELEGIGPEDGPQPDCDPNEMGNPYEDEDLEDYVDGWTGPDPSEFDPMTRSTWSWFMVLAWISWRTTEDVRKCCDEYLEKCWRYHSEARWGPRTEQSGARRSLRGAFLGTKTSLLSEGPMSSGLLAIRAAYSRHRMKMPVKAAEDHLKNALVERDLTASAVSAVTDLPVEVPAFEWAHIQVKDNGELSFTSIGGRVSYRDVKFKRADVMRIWPQDARQKEPTSLEAVNINDAAEDVAVIDAVGDGGVEGALGDVDAVDIKKNMSERDVENAMIELLKRDPGATSRKAAGWAKERGVSRSLVRKKFKKVCESLGIPVKPGRPPKT